MALRGNWDKQTGQENGVFQYFIKWKARFDKVISEHLAHCPSNARYLSPTTQNELIVCIGDEIRQLIIDRANSASYFSAMADESTDVSGTEQMTVCIRYISYKALGANQIIMPVIYEDFLGYIKLDVTDAATISTALCDALTGLEMSKVRGQTYDGASTMSGDVSGVKTRIISKYP